jgi:polyketide synthase PksN
VAGTLAIQRATQDLELKFLVLASSFGALFGNSGQADYSAANSFLDAFAEHRNRLVAQGRCHGNTISINWPLWRSGGMSVTRQAELLMERATGMAPMDTDRGIEAFELVLRSGCEQVLIAQGDAGKIRGALLGGAPARAKATQPVLSADATLIQEMQTGLVAAVSELQKVEAAKVDLDTPLSRYGFDSIGFTELANILNRRYGFEEMPTLFFEYSDLRSAARHLVELYRNLLHARTDRIEGRAIDEQGTPAKPEAPVRGARKLGRLSRARPELPGSRSPRAERIAIIGVGAQFPGSKNLAEFWHHLESNRDLVTEVPAGRWEWPDGGSAPGLSGKRRPITAGGFLSDVDRFDPSFFKISPREAEQIDPQLRVLLETVWATIEDAGYRASALSGCRIGVFAGVGAGGYRELWEQSASVDSIQGAVGHLVCVEPPGAKRGDRHRVFQLTGRAAPRGGEPAQRQLRHGAGRRGEHYVEPLDHAGRRRSGSAQPRRAVQDVFEAR